MLVDESRPERSTSNPDDHRTLPTEIWYPADEAARTAEKAKFSSYFAPELQPLLPSYVPAEVLDLTSVSVRDAAVAGGGPFPLIVFSHGNGGLRMQSFFLTEHLASHGYIVVSPDHTGNAFITVLPGGVIVSAGGEGGIYDPGMAVEDRPPDVSFLVDSMTERNASDPDGRFTGKVDLEHVGLTGHSFGGLTTFLAMAADERFDVGAPMAPAVAGTAIDRPMMEFVATEDRTLSTADMENNYNTTLVGPKMLIRVVDAGHFSFSNMCLLRPDMGDGCGTGMRATGETFTYLDDDEVHRITNYYQTALWGYYLKDVQEYGPDLLAEPFGAETVIDRDGMP